DFERAARAEAPVANQPQGREWANQSEGREWVSPLRAIANIERVRAGVRCVCSAIIATPVTSLLISTESTGAETTPARRARSKTCLFASMTASCALRKGEVGSPSVAA